MIFRRTRHESESEKKASTTQQDELLRAVGELKTTLSTLLARLAKLDTSISDISSRLSSIEKLLSGTFLVQFGGVPSSLDEIVRLLNLRGAVLLRGGREVERYGEIRLDYVDIIDNVRFSTVLMLDQGGVFAYALKDRDRVLYIESDYPLDPYTLSYLRRYLRFT